MNEEICFHNWNNLFNDDKLFVYLCTKCGETRIITAKYIDSLFCDNYAYLCASDVENLNEDHKNMVFDFEMSDQDYEAYIESLNMDMEMFDQIIEECNDDIKNSNNEDI